MEQEFNQWKKNCLSKVDLSKKGSVDDDICDLVSLINDSSCYFTTSSCAGRIILLDSPSDTSHVLKQNIPWLFVTHQHCSLKDVMLGLQSSKGDAVFKFEPFVLHVQCKDMENAKLMHTVAVSSGFRNSGMSVGKRGKIIMAVRSTHCLEVPLSHNGEILVNEDYIQFLVQTANQKMSENLERIHRFHTGLQAALQESHISTVPKKTHNSKSDFKQHRSKTAEMVTEHSQGLDDNCDCEDYLETGLGLLS